MQLFHCPCCRTQVICWSSKLSFHKTPFSKSTTLPRAYREKSACNVQTTKFLLLLKLTFTPTWMWHHEKSIKRGPCRPNTDSWHIITSRSEQVTYMCMHSANQFSTESVAETRALVASVVATKSLVSLLSLAACCWQSGWEHFSSNNWRTVTDRPGTKMQLSSFASITVAIGGIIVFCSSNQVAMFLINTHFNRWQNYDVKFQLYPYTTKNNWLQMILFLVAIKI